MSELTSYYYYEDTVITPATHQYRVYHADDVDKVIAKKDKELNHQKYKRCLDKAERCEVTARFYGNAIPKVLNKDIEDPDRKKVFRRLEHYKKWHLRWLELAKKFKEAK